MTPVESKPASPLATTKEREPTYLTKELLPAEVAKLRGANNRDCVRAGGGGPIGAPKRGLEVAIDLPDIVGGTMGSGKQREWVDNDRKSLLGSGCDGTHIGGVVAGDCKRSSGCSTTERESDGAPGRATTAREASHGSCGMNIGKRTSPPFEIELDALPHTLDLRVPGVYQLHLEMPFPVNADTVTAVFDKSKAVLTVSALEK